jgi:GNAT superfamily N-acetyltransferase
LTSSLNHAAVCFVAFWRGKPVAFDAWLPFFGALKDGRHARREHRVVCLPDYQGVGIGNALSGFCASLWAGQGFRVFTATSHPGKISSLRSGGAWKMTRSPGRTARGHNGIDASRSVNRLSASFEYTGKPLDPAIGRETLNTWADVRPLA